MRVLTLASVAALALAAPALADDVPDLMANLIGNTVVVIDAKGIESRTHYYADHTFDGVAPRYSYHYKGTWELKPDNQLCRTFDPVPPGVTNPDCDALGPLKVGDSWTAPDGGHGTLVAGTN